MNLKEPKNLPPILKFVRKNPCFHARGNAKNFKTLIARRKFLSEDGSAFLHLILISIYYCTAAIAFTNP